MQEPMSILVRFKTGVRPDGALEVVSIVQGDQEIRLTVEQALSLTVTLKAKLDSAQERREGKGQTWKSQVRNT
jgi:hypothetical protein